METKTIVGGVVMITVAIILAGSLLVPVLSDQAAANDTFTNGGYFTYDAVTSDTNVTVSFDPADASIVTIGETSVDMPTENGNYTICGSENFTVRYVKTSTYGNLQVYGTAGYLAGDPNSEDVVSFTIGSENMVFYRNSSTSKTYTTGSHAFVLNADGDGDLTLKTSTDSAYVLADSEIYLCGTTFVTGSGTNDYVGVFGYGTYDDLNMSSFYGNTGDNTVSFGDVTVNYDAVESHIDLYTIDNVTFPLTQNTATVTAIYSYFVVPSEVTAERAVHFSDAESALILVIPVIVIVAILAMAVVMIRRD